MCARAPALCAHQPTPEQPKVFLTGGWWRCEELCERDHAAGRTRQILPPVLIASQDFCRQHPLVVGAADLIADCEPLVTHLARMMMIVAQHWLHAGRLVWCC